jgi:hypothetical protein
VGRAGCGEPPVRCRARLTGQTRNRCRRGPTLSISSRKLTGCAAGAIGPGLASRSGPAELASRDGNDHHGSGGGQGQGRCGCQVPGGDRQPCAEAERRLVRRPQDRHPCPAPHLRQHGLHGHRHRLGHGMMGRHRTPRTSSKRSRLAKLNDARRACSARSCTPLPDEDEI